MLLKVEIRIIERAAEDENRWLLLVPPQELQRLPVLLHAAEDRGEPARQLAQHLHRVDGRAGDEEQALLLRRQQVIESPKEFLPTQRRLLSSRLSQ